jgi:hypothetical protein
MLATDQVAVLRHPLVVALAGFILTSLSAPLIVQNVQERRRKAQKRVELAERTVLAVQTLATAVQFAMVGAASQSQDQFDAVYRTWTLDSAVLGTLLTAHFREQSIADQWTRVRALTGSSYARIGIGAPETATRYLSSVFDAMDETPPRDISNRVVAGNSRMRADVADPTAHLERVELEVERLARLMLEGRVR